MQWLQENNKGRTKIMGKTNLYLTSAILGAFAISGSAMGKYKAPEKGKCYGVAKAGKNDCKGTKNDCKATSKIDNDPDAWKLMTVRDCQKNGGKDFTWMSGSRPKGIVFK